MKKSREFNNVLNDCLERLLVKGETVEQCLENYPKHAAELEPLLRTALEIKGASAIQPHPEFMARARYQFHSALQTAEGRKRRPFFSWQSRWATVVTVLLVLLLVGSGTVVATDNSMPDTPLYPVKLATEQMRLALARSDISKAELHARLTDKRVAEMIYLANKGKPQRIEQTTQRLNTHLARIARLAPAGREEAGAALAPTPMPAPRVGEKDYQPPPAPINHRAKLKRLLAQKAINNPDALRAALQKAPESVRPALRRAIADSVAGYERALKAVEEQPSGQD